MYSGVYTRPLYATTLSELFCKKKTPLFPSGLLCYLFGIESDPMLPNPSFIRAVNSHHSRMYPLTIHYFSVLVTKCSEFLILTNVTRDDLLALVNRTLCPVRCPHGPIGASLGRFSA